MPTGIFPARQKQPPGAIGHPVLRYADAHPRNDLRPIDAATCSTPPQAVAFHRPGTSTGRLQKKTPAPDLYLKASAQCAARPSTSAVGDLNESTIGIALGSPRLLESQMVPHARDKSCYSAAKSKSRFTGGKSRWRKIVFKAKRALTPPPKQPFYQLRVDRDWPLQDSTSSVDPRQQEDYAPQARVPGEDQNEWPRLNSDLASDDTHRNTGIQAKQDVGKMLLQVDIPNIELERYSVMFGGLLGDKSSPSRSSKIPRSLDLPNSPPRAASSHSKSPSFSLFPATPTSKALAVLGTHNPPPGSPLIQSQTVDQLKRRVHKNQASGAPSPMGSSTSIGRPPDSVTLIGSDKRAQRVCHSAADKQRAKTIPPDRTAPSTLSVNTNERSFLRRSSSSTASSENITETTKSANRSAPEAIYEPSPSKSPHKPVNEGDNHGGPNTKEKTDIPKIEVSGAQSVSVSKGKGHAILAIGRGADSMNGDGRLVDRRGKTPLVINGELAHRHIKSQDARIEIMQ